MNLTPIKTTNRLISKNLEDKEKEILQREPLLAFGADFILSENDDNVEDFVYNVMVSYKDRYTTHVVDPDTLLRKPQVHTNVGRHRSLVDLFLLCRYYFPNCTLLQVIKGLYYLNSINVLGYQTCCTVNRRVYECKIKYPAFNLSNPSDYDELNLKVTDYINIFNNP